MAFSQVTSYKILLQRDYPEYLCVGRGVGAIYFDFSEICKNPMVPFELSVD